MRYVKQSTNEVVWVADIRAANPNMSIPDHADCSALGYEKLILTPPPAEVGFHPVEVAPVNNVQQWELVADVVDKGEEETISELTPRQFRLQLLNLGLLDEVENMCSIDKAMSIWFEYSLDFKRDNEMLISAGAQLGLSDEQMDNFFIEASKL